MLRFVYNLKLKDMREILFRGKRVDNDEWVYGNLNRTYSGYTSYVVPKKKSLSYVHPDDCNAKRHNVFSIQIESDNGILKDVKVDKKTIGQFTGLTDKNGVKIFDGDVVLFNGRKCEYVFQDASFGFWGDKRGYGKFYEYSSDIKVIGNIHDKKQEE